MRQFIEDYLNSYSWFRSLTLELVEQLKDDLDKQINDRSLTLRTQVIDMGEFQLKGLGMLMGKQLEMPSQPSMETASSQEIIAYLKECQAVFETEIMNVTEEMKLDWYGRMEFDTKQALNFLMAHETMHHGEILSCVFARDIKMPKAFKLTWGFERNLD
jgi:hypothetical protein